MKQSTAFAEIWIASFAMTVGRAGFLPNEVWRMAGLWFGAGVDERSEVLVWVRAVARPILAGMIAQILMQPPGNGGSAADG